MNYEVEQKYDTPSHADVQTQLERLEAQPLATVSQRDTYYAHPQRDFGSTDEALRIRQVGSRACITYKGPKINSTTKTRRESEVSLAEGAEGADQLDEMLLALGFRHVGMVCKSRQTYHLQREGQQVEVALDEVEGLGCFTELEISRSWKSRKRPQRASSRLSRRSPIWPSSWGSQKSSDLAIWSFCFAARACRRWRRQKV